MIIGARDGYYPCCSKACKDSLVEERVVDHGMVCSKALDALATVAEQEAKKTEDETVCSNVSDTLATGATQEVKQTQHGAALLKAKSYTAPPSANSKSAGPPPT
jgi:hypothetical protein